MVDCPYCGNTFNVRWGIPAARCPQCDLKVRIQDGEAAPVGICAGHPDSAALAACRRCGDFYCFVCRTRWYDRTYCVECVEAMADQGRAQAAKAERGQRWAAILSVIFGLTGWLLGSLFVVAMVAAFFEEESGAGSPLVSTMAYFAVAAAGLGALGVGQAAAAIRARGNYLILATLGLTLGGLLIGVVAAVVLAILVRL